MSNKKVLIIVDSFSGITDEKAKEIGFWFLPQSIIIDGRPFKDGVEIFQHKDYKKIEEAKDLKTSMPPIGLIMDMFEDAAKDYDQVFFFPMNRGMSATSSSSKTVAREYDNVHIMDSRLVGTAIIQVGKKVREMAEQGKNIEEIKKFTKEISDKSHCYIVPKNIEGIIKSGRITGVKKTIMEKVKLIPKLKVIEDGFKTLGIARNFGKTIKSTVNRMIEKINIDDYEFEYFRAVSDSSNDFVISAYAEHNIKPNTVWVPTVVAAHLGIDGIGINAWPKIK